MMTTRRVINGILTAILLFASSLSLHALPTSYYSDTSVLAEGRWVKIKVSETGIYEITFDQLKEWGFDDPAQVSIWGYGGSLLTDNLFTTEIPDDLTSQLTYVSTRFKKICFFGIGEYNFTVKNNSNVTVNRNVYSTAGYYFVTDSRPIVPRSYMELDNSSTRVPIGNHTCVEFFENEEFNPTNGGSYFFDRSLITEEREIEFPVKYVSKADSEFYGNFIYRFASDIRTSVRLIPQADNNLFSFAATNFTTLENNTGEDRTFVLSDACCIPLRYNSENSGSSWKVKFPKMAQTSTMSYVSLDYAMLLYNRNNSMAGSAQLIMSFPSANTGGQLNNFVIPNATEFTQAWNIEDLRNIRPHKLMYNNSDNSLTGSFDRSKNYNATTGAARVAVFNPSRQQKAVEYAGEVANQNIHGEITPNMIIITAPNLLNEAEALADIHRQFQNFDVRVVEQDLIFNEFSSGTPTAMGIRRYAKMLYDRDPQKFRHILFFGMGTWDNRHLFIPDNNHILTYQCENPADAAIISSCYSADAYFGMMGDDVYTGNIRTAVMDVNVGRIPVNNTSDADIVVNKVRDYFMNPPVYGSYNRALLFCDDGDNGDFLNQSESIAEIINELSPATTTAKVYNALYPWNASEQAVAFRDAVGKYLAKGQGYLSYSGHGREDRMGYHQDLWNLTDVDKRDYPISPFTMLATCSTFAFDRVASDITGHMIRKPNGGAINIVAACRAVYKNLNETLSYMIANEYFSSKHGDCTGDVFRRARNAACTAGSSRLATNTLCYNLAGDPAIPLYVPSLNVATLKINGADVIEGEATDINPLVPFTLEGAITDSEGNVKTSFNGIVTIDIYDGATQIWSSTKGETKPEHTRLVTIDETKLCSTVVNVTDGLFSARITVPVPNNPDVTNRISYYAANSDYSEFASGITKSINVKPYDVSVIGENPDVTAPVISDFYINEPTFRSGDEIPEPSVTVFVNIEADPSGINTDGGILGTGAKLVLDGCRNFSGAASSMKLNPDGKASLEFTIDQLADGYHTLEFSVADNAGNRASESLGFITVNRTADVALSVEETTCRNKATFNITHNFKDAPAGRLVIEDAVGNTVYTKSDCSFPFTWDLSDTLNNRVADGHYNAYVMLKGGKQYGNSKRVELVVIK